MTGLFRVDEALRRIRTLVAGRASKVSIERCLPAVAINDPTRPLKARSAVASSFAAVLKRAREGEVTVGQEGPFGPMVVVIPAGRAMTGEHGPHAVEP